MKEDLRETMLRTTKTWKNLDNKILKYDIHPWVFFISAGLIFLGVTLTLLMGDTAKETFLKIQLWITEHVGWFFVLVMNTVLVFCIYLIFSKYSKMRIGGPDAKPEFSTISWFAMLFSAGMGIGVLFYGVAEPVFHFSKNPLALPGTPESAQRAMDLTFLHWGLHPWGIYALVGLALAFFGFSEGLPLSIRNVFYPLLGKKIYGPIGNMIDILATLATLFGVATSLGLGAQQVNAGISHLFGIPQNSTIQVILIAGITACATWSVVKGLDKGIRFLSEINVIAAGLLMLFVLLMGPTVFIMNGFIQNVGHYVQQLPSLATWNETYIGTDWQNSWTLFYWAWWIAWSPFVGMFIARISYGRTIRQYLLGVLLVPAALTFLWMTVFGDTAIFIAQYDEMMAAAVRDNIAISLFVFLEYFPLASIASMLAVIVIITFFVTSSDSASMVIDIITAGGNPDPPKPQRLFWAILEGVVAAVLLIGGGLVALQTAAITTGLPFAAVILMMCWAVHKGLKQFYERVHEQAHKIIEQKPEPPRITEGKSINKHKEKIAGA